MENLASVFEPYIEYGLLMAAFAVGVVAGLLL
jgi:hypothetical protein